MLNSRLHEPGHPSCCLLPLSSISAYSQFQFILVEYALLCEDSIARFIMPPLKIIACYVYPLTTLEGSRMIVAQQLGMETRMHECVNFITPEYIHPDMPIFFHPSCTRARTGLYPTGTLH